MTSDLQQTVAHARHAPLLICAGLAIACVVNAAIVVRSLLQRNTAPGISAPVYEHSRPRAAAEVSRIVAAHLFGTPDATGSVDATGSSLVLTGVLADSQDPRHGAAILGTSVESARYVAAGGVISPGLTLELVYSDHVLLNRSGSSELLRLRGRRGGLVAAIETAASARATDSVASDATDGLPSADELNASIGVQSQRLEQIFHAAGDFDENRFHGITIQPGANAELFASIGFRPGDLITDIDHVPITDPSVLQQFASGRTIGVGVRRPEGTERIEVDTALLRGYIGN